ncbi:MAG: hypothetical protein J6V35_07365 [Bacteroidales bacterium]|nr:hypothetical protein [Bacteroidales bacterium]
MEKLTRQQEDGVCKLLHHTHDENVTQYILETLGKENWTRDILMSCNGNYLTDEQWDLFESLGGGYTSEEMDEFIDNLSINDVIIERLKEQRVTKYLYENEEYIDEIREGRIICEGIDVESIKKMILG